MRINEVYALLYESYRVMQSTWLEFMEWAKENEPKLANRLLDSEGVIQFRFKHDLDINVNTLAEAYEVLMKRNITLDNLDQKLQLKHNDSSYWVRVMKQIMSEGAADRYASDKQLAMRKEIFTLLDKMEETTEKLAKRAIDKKFKKAYEVIEKTPTWIMYQPKHRAAACHLGTGTKWCISARGDDNYYDHYADQADIYIIHTATKKFAILIAAHSGKVFEVQTEKNDFQKPNQEILKQFADQMKSAGVDVARVEELLDVEFDPKWELTGISDATPPRIAADITDKESIYKGQLLSVSPIFVFTNQQTGKKDERHSLITLAIAHKKDGGVDIADGQPREGQLVKGESVAATLVKRATVFEYAHELPDDEKSKLIKKIESLLNDAYQLPPNQQVIAIDELIANAKI